MQSLGVGNGLFQNISKTIEISLFDYIIKRVCLHLFRMFVQSISVINLPNYSKTYPRIFLVVFLIELYNSF